MTDSTNHIYLIGMRPVSVPATVLLLNGEKRRMGKKIDDTSAEFLFQSFIYNKLSLFM